MVFLLNFYVFLMIFNIFWKKFPIFFSNHFFGIFELPWQSSQFWLRWNNFLCSKWLSYRRFTKSILPSSQVENVTAYHPSTIYTSIVHVYFRLPVRVGPLGSSGCLPSGRGVCTSLWDWTTPSGSSATLPSASSTDSPLIYHKELCLR